jgi:hypothetical protein
VAWPPGERAPEPPAPLGRYDAAAEAEAAAAAAAASDDEAAELGKSRPRKRTGGGGGGGGRARAAPSRKRGGEEREERDLSDDEDDADEEETTDEEAMGDLEGGLTIARQKAPRRRAGTAPCLLPPLLAQPAAAKPPPVSRGLLIDGVRRRRDRARAARAEAERARAERTLQFKDVAVFELNRMLHEALDAALEAGDAAGAHWDAWFFDRVHSGAKPTRKLLAVPDYERFVPRGRLRDACLSSMRLRASDPLARNAYPSAAAMLADADNILAAARLYHGHVPPGGAAEPVRVEGPPAAEAAAEDAAPEAAAPSAAPLAEQPPPALAEPGAEAAGAEAPEAAPAEPAPAAAAAELPPAAADAAPETDPEVQPPPADAAPPSVTDAMEVTVAADAPPQPPAPALEPAAAEATAVEPPATTIVAVPTAQPLAAPPPAAVVPRLADVRVVAMAEALVAAIRHEVSLRAEIIAKYERDAAEAQNEPIPEPDEEEEAAPPVPPVRQRGGGGASTKRRRVQRDEEDARFVPGEGDGDDSDEGSVEDSEQDVVMHDRGGGGDRKRRRSPLSTRQRPARGGGGGSAPKPAKKRPPPIDLDDDDDGSMDEFITDDDEEEDEYDEDGTRAPRVRPPKRNAAKGRAVIKTPVARKPPPLTGLKLAEAEGRTEDAARFRLNAVFAKALAALSEVLYPLLQQPAMLSVADYADFVPPEKQRCLADMRARCASADAAALYPDVGSLLADAEMIFDAATAYNTPLDGSDGGEQSWPGTPLQARKMVDHLTAELKKKKTADEVTQLQVASGAPPPTELAPPPSPMAGLKLAEAEGRTEDAARFRLNAVFAKALAALSSLPAFTLFEEPAMLSVADYADFVPLDKQRCLADMRARCASADAAALYPDVRSLLADAEMLYDAALAYHTPLDGSRGGDQAWAEVPPSARKLADQLLARLTKVADVVTQLQEASGAEPPTELGLAPKPAKPLFKSVKLYGDAPTTEPTAEAQAEVPLMKVKFGLVKLVEPPQPDETAAAVAADVPPVVDDAERKRLKAEKKARKAEKRARAAAAAATAGGDAPPPDDAGEQQDAGADSP